MGRSVLADDAEGGLDGEREGEEEPHCGDEDGDGATATHFAEFAGEDAAHLAECFVGVCELEVFAEEDDAEEAFCFFFAEHGGGLEGVLVHGEEEVHGVSHAAKVGFAVWHLVVGHRHVDHEGCLGRHFDVPEDIGETDYGGADPSCDGQERASEGVALEGRLQHGTHDGEEPCRDGAGDVIPGISIGPMPAYCETALQSDLRERITRRNP